ncbi:SpoIIE family protein phosphatase [Nonomuraea jiangxiensis]|uniref:Anti-sigma regulatory factor (Ser/Thr protein kinase) n=1 Tax=Nonomuraea jiangxiensis TaxID=633440 RepID=A0A1G9F629_9ACTN|nr:SpoIIE family protein phosphatase [Nonomuraea jiangxiensis]SDK83806.1 Anti-sigma regulatory factor (Ser/Thr protein kinase) [Nonomuraea jiangxiensis]
MITTEIRLDHESAIAHAVSVTRQAARELDLTPLLTERAAVTASELSSNIVKHTHGGVLLVQPEPVGGLELLALDRGPGMDDVARCLADGYSSAGTLGSGLGAVRRLATTFGIFSHPRRGTAIFARFGAAPSAARTGTLRLPAAGEDHSGDAYTLVETADATLVLVVDGLGRGAEAARVSRSATEAFLLDPGRPLPQAMEAIHAALRNTRGAAATAVRLPRDAAEVEFCGVGNVNAVVLDGDGPPVLMTPQPGTLGLRIPPFRRQTAPLPAGATVVVHSDGIAPGWSRAAGGWMFTQAPPLLVGLLARDHRRYRDDATIVALREW